MKIIPLGGCILLLVASAFAFAASADIAQNTRVAAPPLWQRTCTITKDRKEQALITDCHGWKKQETLSASADALIDREASLMVHCTAFAKEWPADDLDVVCK